jgi:hypothetical protein
MTYRQSSHSDHQDPRQQPLTSVPSVASLTTSQPGSSSADGVPLSDVLLTASRSGKEAGSDALFWPYSNAQETPLTAYR